MRNRPPRLGTWLLRLICSDENFDEISGDLEEIYQGSTSSQRKVRCKRFVCQRCIDVDAERAGVSYKWTYDSQPHHHSVPVTS